MMAVGALEAWARLRLIERNSPLTSHFDYDHIEAIHRHIQDTFAWAGQRRSAPMGLRPMIQVRPRHCQRSPTLRDLFGPHRYAPAEAATDRATLPQYKLFWEADYLRGLALKGEFVDSFSLL